METLLAWVFGIFGAVGWILFGRAIYDKREWQKEKVVLMENVIRLELLHKQNKAEIESLKLQLKNQADQQIKFNARMERITQMFDEFNNKKIDDNAPH